MTGGKRKLVLYELASGKVPFEQWLSGLKDRRARAIIRVRLDRLALGNAGVYKFIASGVYELKIDFGPGYRLYFCEDGKMFIVLLCGGDKSTQEKDIRKALSYWNDYWSKK